MRIAKYLARLGVCSRREAEKLIAQERVTVNGEVLKDAAFNVSGDEKILLDGEKLPKKQLTRLWLYHKPAGLVTTHKDEKNRPTVFDNLPPNMPRVISIGRLDLNSEGLLLLTNDGEWARKMELPSNGWKRTYRVRVHGIVSPEVIGRLHKGIKIDGIQYAPCMVEIEKKQSTLKVDCAKTIFC
jgi:23S rRNA pseudouridine2605 synthase